jgi:hypothetical protein
LDHNSVPPGSQQLGRRSLLRFKCSRQAVTSNRVVATSAGVERLFSDNLFPPFPWAARQLFNDQLFLVRVFSIVCACGK